MKKTAAKGWTTISENRHVHSSGTVLERRGRPIPHGWYLFSAREDVPTRVFAPTAEGRDEAFAVFADRYSAASL